MTSVEPSRDVDGGMEGGCGNACQPIPPPPSLGESIYCHDPLHFPSTSCARSSVTVCLRALQCEAVEFQNQGRTKTETTRRSFFISMGQPGCRFF